MDIFRTALHQHPTELAAFLAASHAPTSPVYPSTIQALASRTIASASALAKQHPDAAGAEAIILADGEKMPLRAANALCEALTEHGTFGGESSYLAIIRAIQHSH